MRSDGKTLQIVQGLDLNEFSRAKINASVDELKGEKAIATELGLVLRRFEDPPQMLNFT